MNAKTVGTRTGNYQGAGEVTLETGKRGKRQRATTKLRSVGSRLGDAAHSGAEQVRSNPFAAVVGAAAVSAGLALLLPSSRREAEVMGEVADRIGEAARDAADSAIEVGRHQVEALAQTALASVGGVVMQAVVAGDAANVPEGNDADRPRTGQLPG